MIFYDQIDGEGRVVRSGFTIGMYDQLPEGHTWVERTDSFDYLRNKKKASIEDWRDAACIANVTLLGHSWQADSRSQALLSNAVSLAQAGVIDAPPVWRTADNVNVPVGLDDLKYIAAAIAVQTNSAYTRSWALKAQADAATTLEALDAITWE